ALPVSRWNAIALYLTGPDQARNHALGGQRNIELAVDELASCVMRCACVQERIIDLKPGTAAAAHCVVHVGDGHRRRNAIDSDHQRYGCDRGFCVMSCGPLSQNHGDPEAAAARVGMHALCRKRYKVTDLLKVVGRGERGCAVAREEELEEE